MTQPLLIEIGVEELPAVPLLKELSQIEKKWAGILESKNLLCDFEFYYTPRRLVLWHKSFKTKQDDSVEEFFGAPMAVAYKDGVATKAAEGFARKCGVTLDEVSSADKGGKEVLYFKKDVVGKESQTLLNSMIEEWIKSLSFGKSMRWGSSSETFIRPVRWVNVLMNDTLVDVTLFNVASKATTMVHRMSEFDAISVSGAKEYFETLKSGGVTLFQDERRKNILTQFDALEKIKSISIEIDTELLDEVVAITEHPTALIGTFDEAFLRLPDEVIITSMKEHQRYFPVFKEGKLTNQFCVVSNAYTENFSKIIEGNETVLRPRLADALFFYDNDLKRGLKTDGLEKVVFMKGLGSVEDKISREMHIATILHAMYHDKDKMGSSTDLTQAVSLAKADLMSEMVYEFTELQGLMGYYYATELGENEHVALAIKEQYLPDGEDSLLPSTPLSAIVAMSIKIDTLLALFSINQIPTGSRDPFALRRAVLGIMRIVKDNNFYFDIKETLGALSAQYSDIDMEKLENFIIERINQFYSNSKNINPSVIKSVLNTGERELIQLDAKINAVAALVESDSFATLSSTFKRVANISKDAEVIAIDEALFSEVAESKLFKAYDEVSKRSYENYEFELDALFSLKPQLDNFFDNVMVNAEDEAVKNNRKSLVATIYNAISKIADIKEITL